MLETLLTTGVSTGFYPNSGPGPKSLITGDENFGYFGIVNDSEMDNISNTLFELIRQTSFGSKAVKGINNKWIKVFYKRKVLYYPVDVVTYSVSIFALAAARILRSDGRGIEFNTTTSPNGPVNYTAGSQDTVLSVKRGSTSWGLKPRLPLSSRTAQIAENTVEAKSELGELIPALFGYRLPDFLKVPGVVLTKLENGESASNFLTGELYHDYSIRTEEAYKGKPNRTNSEFRATLTSTPPYAMVVQTLNPATGPSNNWNYRPILELVEKNEPVTYRVFPVSSPEAKTYVEEFTQAAPTTANASYVSEIENAKSTTTIDTIDQQPFSVNINTATTALVSGLTDLSGKNGASLDSQSDSVPILVSALVQDDVVGISSPQTSEEGAIPPIYFSATGGAAATVTIAAQLSAFDFFSPGLNDALSKDFGATLGLSYTPAKFEFFSPGLYDSVNNDMQAQLYL